jgi:hypothetical protein
LSSFSNRLGRKITIWKMRKYEKKGRLYLTIYRLGREEGGKK